VCEGRHSISVDEGELKDVLSTCKTLTTIEAGNWTNEPTNEKFYNRNKIELGRGLNRQNRACVTPESALKVRASYIY